MALINKKVMNFAYGMGAAVVIVGALFKIQHWTGASELLVIGLLTEAFIFGLSAFDPVEDDHVVTEPSGPVDSDANGELSKKLDEMLKEAKIDGELMASLGNSIKNFESAAKGIAPTVDSLASTKKYSEELTKAAAQMESLNNLYKLQLESASVNAEANKDIAENAAMLKQQMQSMTTNIASLNAVYGGMLSAMSNKG
jgi:gliding motility-associated protein GldL